MQRAVNRKIESSNFKEILLDIDILSISSLIVLLCKRNINEIEKKEKRILINKVTQQILNSMRLKLSEFHTQKLRLKENIEILENFEDVENKKRLLDNFIYNEFDDISDTSNILKSIKEKSDAFKKQTKEKIGTYEKSVLKSIGTLIDTKGKEKGVEILKNNFRQFNIEIQADIKNNIANCMEDMKKLLKRQIDDIFIYLKHHELALKFNIKTADFNRLKEDISFFGLDSIEEGIKNIKIKLPTLDISCFGNSEGYIKDILYEFSDKYFDSLRDKINEIYHDFDFLLQQKLGTKNEMKPFFRNKLIAPLKKSLYEIEEVVKENKNLKAEKESELDVINQKITVLENKIQEIETQLKD